MVWCVSERLMQGEVGKVAVSYVNPRGVRCTRNTGNKFPEKELGAATTNRFDAMICSFMRPAIDYRHGYGQIVCSGDQQLRPSCKFWSNFAQFSMGCGYLHPQYID